MGAMQEGADPWERWGALAGYVFVAAALFAIVVNLAAGTPRNGSPLALARFIVGHRIALELAWYAGLLAAFTALIWLTTLACSFGRHVEPWDGPILILLIGGALAIVLHLAADGAQAVSLFYTPGRTAPNITYAFFTAGSVLTKLGEISAGVALLAIALSLFRAIGAPRSLGWIALAAGVIDIAANVVAIPIPWFGYVAAVGLIGLLFVVVDTSDIMFRSRKGMEPTAHAK